MGSDDVVLEIWAKSGTVKVEGRYRRASSVVSDVEEGRRRCRWGIRLIEPRFYGWT